MERNSARLAEDTIVVLTSDHGEMLGDHYLKAKLGYLDESFHIPLIVRRPGGAPGLVVDSFTENVDIMPTVLELHQPPDVTSDWRGLI